LLTYHEEQIEKITWLAALNDKFHFYFKSQQFVCPTISYECLSASGVAVAKWLEQLTENWETGVQSPVWQNL